MVKNGARVAQKDWLGNDSIFYAIKNSNPAILEVLLKYSQEKINLDERFTVRYCFSGNN
jgi:ankyrin repeat protein